MAEDQTPEPNADTPPPGSSESFNEFKDRILNTFGGYAAANEGHNTVFVTHSKGIGVLNGWEHAGYPEDNSIHMPTYEESKEKAPGGHEAISIPDYITDAQLKKASMQAITTPLDESKQIDAKDVFGISPLANTLYEGAKKMFSGENDYKEISPQEAINIPANNPMLAMFGGRRANLNRAEFYKRSNAVKMLAEGEEPSEVFKKTGWYLDDDGHLKMVIPTDEAFLKTDKAFQEHFSRDEGTVYSLKNSSNPFSRYKLSDIYDNPEFYRLYPKAKDILIGWIDSDTGNASWDQPWWLAPNGIISFRDGMTGQEIFKSLHHELQHFIQYEEGFPSGASPRLFSGSESEAHDQYLRTRGEIEARTASEYAQHSDLGKEMLQDEGISPAQIMRDQYPTDKQILMPIKSKRSLNKNVGAEKRINPDDKVTMEVGTLDKILDARIKGSLSADTSIASRQRLAKELNISQDELNERVKRIVEEDPKRFGKIDIPTPLPKTSRAAGPGRSGGYGIPIEGDPSSLKETDRQIYDMFNKDRKSFSQIGKEMNMSRNSVSSRVRKIRLLLERGTSYIKRKPKEEE